MYRSAIVIAILAVLGPVLLTGHIRQVHAVGETYDLSPSPSRMQQASSAGVSLVLAVGNATVSATYSFTWEVSDPSGVARSAINSTLSMQPSWTLGVNYPRSFAGGSLSLVGTYAVNVSQTSPVQRPGVAVTQFEVGLTDSLAYQRTSQVFIKAEGYLPNDNVTINISRGAIPAQEFPTWKLADVNGIFSHTWQIPPEATTGEYVANLTGRNTPPKSRPDTQNFTVSPAIVSVPGVWLGRSSFQRTDTVDLRFNATYPDGRSVGSGSSILRIVEPYGDTSHLIPAFYDLTLGTFHCTYKISLAAPTGIWVAVLESSGFDDGYGNRGPSESMVTGFTVQPATLEVLPTLSQEMYRTGDTMIILVTVTGPDGSIFSQGSVVGSFAIYGQRVTDPIVMTFDQTRGRWVSSYVVGESNPSGTWVLDVEASDPYGNSGRASVASVVSVSQQKPAYMELSSWLPVVVVLGVALAIIAVRYRKVTRSEVKLDIQAVKNQADKVKGDSFFKSLQAQLERHRERMKKESPDEANR